MNLPYQSNADLPDSVTNVLPSAAQNVWRTVFNDTMAEHQEEGRAMATAWRAVGNGWKKTTAGRWVRKEDPDDEEVGKANKQVRWSRELQFAKTDTDQQLVFGWLSVAVDKDGNAIEDSQGDIIPPDELEKAAYDFVLYARKAGEMHKTTEGIGRLVESMVFTKEKCEALGIPDGTLPISGWWCGFHIDNVEVWAKVKSGEYRAFSIGGRGVREEV